MANPASLSYIHYGWETTFGTATTTSNKIFGHGCKFTTLRRANNMERIYQIGARNAQKIVAGKFEGSGTIEFSLANPWFLKAVFGTVSSTGTNPTTHTFTEYNTLPSMTITNDVRTDTASVAKLLGTTVNQFVLTAAVGEIPKGRLDILWANESHSSTTATPVTESFDVYTFAQGSVELPDGTTIAKVQNIEATVNNTAEMVFGLGSRTGVACPVKKREYSARATLAFTASDIMLEKLYGNSTGVDTAKVDETATMELVFDNGLTSANQRQVSLLFTGVQIDEDNMPQDPATLIMEDVNMMMRSCTCTAKNATTTCP